MAKPNFTGVWRLDGVMSIMKGTPPRELLMKITHRGSAIRQQVLSVRESGEMNQTFEMSIGGETVNVAQGMTLTTRADWSGDTLVLESRSGEVRFEDHWSLSTGGDILTMAHHNDPLDGQVAVFERGSNADAKRFG